MTLRHVAEYLLGPNVGWRELILAGLDIALVATLCFRVLLLIRGTRAVRVLAGLFLLGLGYVGAEWAGLTTFEWILGHFLSYSILFGVIVLFQDDIRRGLAQLGQGGVLAALTRHEQAARVSLVEALVRAAQEMARCRHGALVVLERAAELSEVVDTGVKLDAAVASELLLAVFHPGGPLHDGAAIIRGGRLVAAGCVLPLTHAQTGRDLGTRHRAAVGLTEEVDALVVVVSEERGEISVAVDGALHRHLDEQALRETLQKLLANRGVLSSPPSEPEPESAPAEPAGKVG